MRLDEKYRKPRNLQWFCRSFFIHFCRGDIAPLPPPGRAVENTVESLFKPAPLPQKFELLPQSLFECFPELFHRKTSKNASFRTKFAETNTPLIFVRVSASNLPSISPTARLFVLFFLQKMRHSLPYRPLLPHRRTVLVQLDHTPPTVSPMLKRISPKGLDKIFTPTRTARKHHDCMVKFNIIII